MTACFSRDNQTLLCVTAWNEVKLHNIVAEKTVHRFSPPENQVYFAAFTPDEKKVVILGQTTGATEARQLSLFLYDLPARLLDPPAARVDDAALEKMWPDLTSDNDARLQLVLKALRSAPKQAVTLFRKEVAPVARERQRQVEQWIAELDADAFARRDQAMKELQGAAHEFAPLLRARHGMAGPGEIRNRLMFVLGKMEKESVPASLVRHARVVALLEQTATLEARAFLAELAQGAPDARLTREARGALARLQGKAAPK
jgi:hypothetical protein